MLGPWTLPLMRALGACGEFSRAERRIAASAGPGERRSLEAELALGGSLGGHAGEALAVARSAARHVGELSAGGQVRVAQALAHAGDAAAVEVLERASGQVTTCAEECHGRIVVATGLFPHAPEEAAALAAGAAEELTEMFGPPLAGLAALALAFPGRELGSAYRETVEEAAAFRRRSRQEWQAEPALVLAFLIRLGHLSASPEAAADLERWLNDQPPDGPAGTGPALLAAARGDAAAVRRAAGACGSAAALTAAASALADVPTVLPATTDAPDYLPLLALRLA